VTSESEEQTERDQREEELTEAKLPAGLASDGRDETLTSQEPLDAAGTGKNNRVTPPHTSIPDDEQSDEPGL
jgi:hypothetical protein